MFRSASESQESVTEGIFVEPPLSFLLLEGLLEVGGGKLEHAGLGPIGEQVEEIAQVAPGLEAVELTAGDQRDLATDPQKRKPRLRVPGSSFCFVS